jgi:ArsR family transcriptional regulator, arsenate/arsenite/antimonite-responsive transcriptional repressor
MSNYKSIEQYTEMFKALSSPNRLRIFLRLISCCSAGTEWSLPEKSNSASEGCTCVGDLGQDLGIVPSTLSHHIKELRQAGLIRMKRNGQKIEYFIDPGAVAALRNFFNTTGLYFKE